MKKPTHPLPRDLRFGGYLALPILQSYENLSNVANPYGLFAQSGLTEPLISWTLHAAYKLGILKPHVLQDSGVFHHLNRHEIPRRQHFVPRLSTKRVDQLIQRVIANAQRANNTDSSWFTFDMVGLFGSVLNGRPNPGDVDVVYVARDRETGELIPESDYYPFSSDRPTDKAASILRGGARRVDLSCHDLREVIKIGASYKEIWTREEGVVDRFHAVSPKRVPYDDDGPDGQRATDERCIAFRRLCEMAPPLPLPRNFDQVSAEAMKFDEWITIVEEDGIVPLLAHLECTPNGPVKDCLAEAVKLQSAGAPRSVDEARHLLPSYLRASAKYGTWRWDPASGLVPGKRYTRDQIFKLRSQGR